MKTLKIIALIAAFSMPAVTVTGIMDYITSQTIGYTLGAFSALGLMYNAYKYNFHEFKQDTGLGLSNEHKTEFCLNCHKYDGLLTKYVIFTGMFIMGMGINNQYFSI